MEKEDIYHRALRVWGKEPQMLQVVEEMSELIKEILKYLYFIIIIMESLLNQYLLKIHLRFHQVFSLLLITINMYLLMLMVYQIMIC